MRILNKFENIICTSITALQLLTELNKGKYMHIILLTDNRIVSYEVLVSEMEIFSTWK